MASSAWKKKARSLPGVRGCAGSTVTGVMWAGTPRTPRVAFGGSAVSLAPLGLLLRCALLQRQRSHALLLFTPLRPPSSTLLPYTTLFRSAVACPVPTTGTAAIGPSPDGAIVGIAVATADRKSTRLNSSHEGISYGVFCLEEKSQEFAGREGVRRLDRDRRDVGRDAAHAPRRVRRLCRLPRSPRSAAPLRSPAAPALARASSFHTPAAPELDTPSLHDALPICRGLPGPHDRHSGHRAEPGRGDRGHRGGDGRSEEHTSELQSRGDLVWRLLPGRKKPGVCRA